MKLKLFLLLYLTSTTFAFAQFKPALYMINGHTLPYQVMYPKDYDASKRYPLVVFLHGAGERGLDNQKQLGNGAENFLLNNFQSQYPAIVIAPQCPETSYWSNVEKSVLDGKTSFVFGVNDQPTEAMYALTHLVEFWLKSGKVNLSQVYVGGLSMGGMGTYELLWRLPNTFIAAFPICGGGDVNKIVNNTRNTAIWMFHGADDVVVSVSFAQDMHQQLEEAGLEVKYTEYPGVNHNSWDNVFQNKEIVPWLFQH